ncbi:MAG: hypothetical protein ACOCV2_08515, partial [Persicimonas sp.]
MKSHNGIEFMKDFHHIASVVPTRRVRAAFPGWMVAAVTLAAWLFASAPVAGQDLPDLQGAAEQQQRAGTESGSSASRSAVEQERKTVESQASQHVQNLFSRLCPGRCELVDLEVTMDDPSPDGSAAPGFESGPADAYEASADSIEMAVMIDSNLPSSFQSSLPRMIEYQLSNLAENIEVRPEMLDFPEPQH